MTGHEEVLPETACARCGLVQAGTGGSWVTARGAWLCEGCTDALWEELQPRGPVARCFCHRGHPYACPLSGEAMLARIYRGAA